MKRLLFSLLIGFVGLVGFGYCQEYVSSNYYGLSSSTTIQVGIDDIFCIRPISNNRSVHIQLNSQGDFIDTPLGGLLCVRGVSDVYFDYQNNSAQYFILSGFTSSSSCDYSGYILESEIDINYCVGNDLCPVSTGLSWSELVINDIVHESAPLININIPEEFNWNYAVDENEFALSISGYNVDTEYIDGIITAQNVKPDSGTLNKIITELIPLFVPGLVIILFIWFVFRFIKKIF